MCTVLYDYSFSSSAQDKCSAFSLIWLPLGTQHDGSVTYSHNLSPPITQQSPSGAPPDSSETSADDTVTPDPQRSPPAKKPTAPTSAQRNRGQGRLGLRALGPLHQLWFDLDDGADDGAHVDTTHNHDGSSSANGRHGPRVSAGLCTDSVATRGHWCVHHLEMRLWCHPGVLKHDPNARLPCFMR
eukprot:CAMPEP_0185695544 /NCGR_PEP_ID=MMETSP1164-20130828/4574_1 /TAXON_ID=1104430 /ORGANISM="Chrysoreinhardia sp, Strain CCMP2950" /LENGTH=184 /DNA_ID=CAMNT_0028362405 /DNA_START=551 /DNA_END=1105 /DNA_ORIENTATION=+